MQREKNYLLKEFEELRVEVRESKIVKVKIVGKGSAEIFGTELALDRDYQFTNANFSIFT